MFELKKKILLQNIFLAGGNLVNKRKVYTMKIIILNSATEGYHKFHVRPYKDLKIPVLVTSILLLTRVYSALI